MSTFSMKTRVCRHLDKYVSDRVWSDPYLESRIITRPSILNPASVAREPEEDIGNIPVISETRWSPYTPINGVLYGDFEQIGLPEGGPFYVYSVDLEQIRSIKLNATSWISLADYCTGSIEQSLSPRMTTFKVLTDGCVLKDDKWVNSGICIPMSKCYIKQAPWAEAILLAVNADVFHKCSDIWTQVTSIDETGVHLTIQKTRVADPSKVFFETYVDSDYAPKAGVLEVYTPDNVIKTEILTSDDIVRLKNPDPKFSINPVDHGAEQHDLTFLNGRIINSEFESSYTGSLAEGDIVEYIDDEDIVTQLRYVRNAVDKYSTEHDGEYALVHVPLVDNPHKYLISYLTCDVYIFPRQVVEDKTKANYAPGILGFRVHMADRQTESSPLFRQLTFNDFGISLAKLDEYARDAGVLDVDGIPDYTIKVVVRHHNKKLGITRDADYCDLLYDSMHSDIDIISFLTSDIAPYTDDMWFWTGKYLHETSAYAVAMNQKLGSTVDPKVQCNRCSVKKECDHLKSQPTGKLSDTICPDFTVRGVNEYVNILGYYNTLHLIAKRVTTYKVVPMRQVDSKLVFSGGTYECITRAINRTIPVQTPVAFADRDPKTFHPIVYLNGLKLEDTLVTNKGYGRGNTDGLSPIHYTYTPRHNEVNWSGENRWIDIEISEDVAVKEGDYITVELIALDEDESISVANVTFDIHQGICTPIGGKSSVVTGTSGIEGTTPAATVAKNVYYPVTSDGKGVTRQSHEQVYLNGKHLVESIDYMPFSEYAKTTFEPIVQNVSYLQKKNNRLSVVTTPDRTVGVVKGFTIGDWIMWRDISTIWFDDLSILVVDGKVQNQFAYKYLGFDMSNAGIRNGAPYMVRTCVAEKIAQLLDDECAVVDGYTVKELDDMKLRIIAEYFATHTPVKPHRAVIPYEHRIYSTYLLAIINAYLTTDFDFELLTDRKKFEDQFSAFAKYKKLDVVYSERGITKDDLRFVDVYPTYYNVQVNSTVQRRKIIYMVQMLLPADAMRHRRHINV